MKWFIGKIVDELISRLRRAGYEVQHRQVLCLTLSVDSTEAEASIARMREQVNSLADSMKTVEGRL